MPNVMAALPNMGGALCESSVIPFLVPRRKVWLTPVAGVPCQYRRTQDLDVLNFARGKIPSGTRTPKSVYIAERPNIVQTLVGLRWSTSLQSKPKRETRWNLLGCTKPANRSQPLVGRSSPILCGMWRRYCCLTSFFPICTKATSCVAVW